MTKGWIINVCAFICVTVLFFSLILSNVEKLTLHRLKIAYPSYSTPAEIIRYFIKKKNYFCVLCVVPLRIRRVDFLYLVSNVFIFFYMHLWGETTYPLRFLLHFVFLRILLYVKRNEVQKQNENIYKKGFLNDETVALHVAGVFFIIFYFVLF